MHVVHKREDYAVAFYKLSANRVKTIYESELLGPDCATSNAVLEAFSYLAAGTNNPTNQ